MRQIGGKDNLTCKHKHTLKGVWDSLDGNKRAAKACLDCKRIELGPFLVRKGDLTNGK